jgi:predicted metal-dependent HD superfamily phosphohydrolase
LLDQLFKSTVLLYTADQNRSESLWSEILKNYSEKKRHYHTLSHLENLWTELMAVKNLISDRDVVVFALFYHDLVYKSTASDNEEKSAARAKERLQQISFPQLKINKCADLILATKGHTISGDSDTNLFTDADLSILGKPWTLYEEYFRNVRKEYSIYPDFLYNPGRKKVLSHFLTMDRIFKTDRFYELYETQARENLRSEIEKL